MQVAVDKQVTKLIYGATDILASSSDKTISNIFTFCAWFSVFFVCLLFTILVNWIELSELPVLEYYTVFFQSDNRKDTCMAFHALIVITRIIIIECAHWNLTWRI